MLTRAGRGLFSDTGSHVSCLCPPRLDTLYPREQQAIPSLNLLLQVVLHPHAQLVKLVPLLRQPHGAVFCVLVVQDKCLFHGSSKVLNLLQLAPHRSDLLVLALVGGSKEKKVKESRNSHRKVGQSGRGGRAVFFLLGLYTHREGSVQEFSELCSSLHTLLETRACKPALETKSLLLGNVLKERDPLCPTPSPRKEQSGK